MSVGDIVDTLVNVLVAVLASGGLWTLLNNVTKRKSGTLQLLLGLAHYRILHTGGRFIDRGWVTHAELEEFNKCLAYPYLESGGNGHAKHIIKLVNELPQKPNNYRPEEVDKAHNDF